MRIVLQRVKKGGVTIAGLETREICGGVVALVGISPGDDAQTAKFMAEKTANLRIFGDENGAMNLSLLDVGGDALVVSNFTLYANCKKGRRPSFTDAAAPEKAEGLYELFVAELIAQGVNDVKTGVFGADMRVGIINDGPVTIILDSAELLAGK